MYKLMEIAYYFKRYWPDATGNELTNNWGQSTYYFETNLEYTVLRQIQLFENGRILKYDNEYVGDKFGGLSEALLDNSEFEKFRIDKSEFENVWQNSFYKKYPEIVCTPDTLWGQPRLEGRRLTVGDIVSLVDIYHEDISITMKDFQLSIQQIRQTLQYCKILECKKDKPEKFCYNCLLRVEQDNKLVDKQDPEQPNWMIAAKLFDKYFTNTTNERTDN